MELKANQELDRRACKFFGCFIKRGTNHIANEEATLAIWFTANIIYIVMADHLI